MLAPFQVLRAVAGFVIGLSSLALAATGVFRDARGDDAPQLVALAGLSILLVTRLFDRLQGAERAVARRRVWRDLELGTLFVAAAFVLIEVTGGPAGLMYPLIYALIAFLMAFHSLPLGLAFLGLIIVTEAGINALQPGAADWRLFASHASFNTLFGFLYALFLRSEITVQRERVDRELTDHLQRIEREAREFRLTSGLSLESRELGADELGRRRKQGSVQAIHESLYNVLAVAERALEPHTVALLWMDPDDKTLRVKELRSVSDHVTENPINAGEGIVGAITKRKEPLTLTNLRADYSGIVYYERPQPVTDFAGVPVMEGAHLRGVLVADRADGRAFDEADVAVLQTIAAEIVRAVQVERIFSDMDREKTQKERFYQASREFNAARTVDEVAKVAIEAARRVSQAEFAGLAVSLEHDDTLRVAAIEWPGATGVQELVGRTFAAHQGLVGAALKARHALPHGTARAASQCVFSPELEVKLAGVKVMPLLWKEFGVGGLVLGSSREDFLTQDSLEMVRVIADHAAIAIANAQMYERMERMATTDGLTGLTNHRQFQLVFEHAIARAERYGRKLSLILTDIDHFKSVNDTYGHPVGDIVLKRVAAMLASAARRTDIVARYGGEEFAVLMEETDREGAVQIAERIRKTVEAEMFKTETGTFKTTLSLGVATFPEDATQKARFAEAADQALYTAKRSGRNRVVTFRSMSSRREVNPA